MPKKKTVKSAAKRCKLSARGKVLFARAGRSHLLGNKSRKRKRKMRGFRVANPADQARIRALLMS